MKTIKLAGVVALALAHASAAAQIQLPRAGNINDIQWYPVVTPSGRSIAQSSNEQVGSSWDTVRFLVKYSIGLGFSLELLEANCQTHAARLIGWGSVDRTGGFALRDPAARVSGWFVPEPGTDEREMVDGACT